jgi:hypothetical protein
VTLRSWAATAALGIVLMSGCTNGDGEEDGAASPTTAGRQGAATTTTPRITGGPFCEFALTFNDRFGRVGADAANPQRVRATFEEATRAAEEAEQIAPPEIRSDVATLAGTFRDLLAILREANFDFSRVPPASLERLSSPEVQASNQRLDNYVRQNCRAG